MNNGQLASVIRRMVLQEPAILADYLEDRLGDDVCGKVELLGVLRAGLVSVTASTHSLLPRIINRVGSRNQVNPLNPCLATIPLELRSLSKHSIRIRWLWAGWSGRAHDNDCRNAVPDLPATVKVQTLELKSRCGCHWAFRPVDASHEGPLNKSLFALVWIVYDWSWKAHPAVGEFLNAIDRSKL